MEEEEEDPLSLPALLCILYNYYIYISYELDQESSPSTHQLCVYINPTWKTFFVWSDFVMKKLNKKTEQYQTRSS